MIPRKILYESDKNLLLEHFKNDIVANDRYLRFGMSASDYYVEQYIERSLKDFGKTNMWFIVDVGGRCVGTVHISIFGDGVAEMGFTVSSDYRGKGIGQSLFSRGAIWSAMKGAKTIYTHCLSENKVMQHIARKNGMDVVTVDMGEKEASVNITKNATESFFEDLVLDNMAFVDTAITKQKQLMNKYLRLWPKG